MERRVYIALVVLLFTLSAERADAQYYDWGQDPASIKWQQIDTENGKVVFPREYQRQAVRIMHYMDTVRGQVGHGFAYGTMKFPLFLHTQNFSSNGLVVMAPRRMELIPAPPAQTFAAPWLKQLSIHELRHNVQFSNINQNVFKVLGKIFGEHGSIIGTLLFPYWAMEGDAVLTETQFTEFGRGVQPSQTLAYRALALEGRGGDFKRDKFFSGSYIDYLPDHYHLGYQLTSWAYTKHGSDYWSRVVDYGTRRPYQLFTAKVAQRKYFGSSTNKLFDGAFENLRKHWISLPFEDNSADIINTPTTSYTTYSTPIAVANGQIAALKSDFDRTSRIVLVDEESGRERVLHRTGIINTGLSYDGERLWWSELRNSTLWEQRVNSVVCWYDLTTGESGRIKGERRASFPVGVGGGKYAVVEYDYSGYQSIKQGEWRLQMAETISLHGLAWDDKTERYYFTALSDEGMWIGSVEQGGESYEVVTKPNYSTISDLRAEGGSLYYGSIASGKDEAHRYDLASGVEYRVTTSRYGSFSPSPRGEGGAVVTTYTPNGYMLALQESSEETDSIVEWSRLPRNVVNPKRAEWDVMKIESVTVAETTDREIKKHRKGLNLFQFHSWLPAHLDPEELLSERSFDIDIGVTLMSQNLLNNMFGTLGYKYTSDGSFFTAGLKYMGFPVKLEAEAEYGLMDQLVYQPQLEEVITRGKTSTQGFDLSNSFRLTARAYLPMVLSSGYHVRVLRPMVEFEHHNAKLFYLHKVGGETVPNFRNGIQKMILSLFYSDNVRMAHRDFLPRWGYAARVRYITAPFNNSFGKTWSAFGRVYVPGLYAHHSLMLRGALQRQSIKTWGIRQKELFPRGASYRIVPERYWSMSGDYQLPVWYPDGGIESVLYFKRVRVNVWGDFARYRDVKRRWRNITSYGVDLTLDVVPFRLPSNMNTSITISIRKPSTEKGVNFGFGIGIPL